MAILKSNMNINGIKRLVHQYALSKSKLTGGAGKLTDEDKPPLFVGEFSMLALDEDELNHHTIEEIFKTEYDGVLITQVDIAANKKGQQWVFQMFQDIELYLKENDVNKIILVEDAASSFANDNFDIQNTVDGIVMYNPTMDMDGNLKPFFGERYNNIQNLTRLLKDVTSRRQNFVVIGLEVFSNEDCIDPSAIKRFFRRSWAGDIQMACTICTDPTFTDPKAVFNDASKSGSAILSVVDMLTEGVGKSIGDRVRNLIKNRGYTSVASSSQVTRKWNPETCLRPDNNNNYTVDTRELIAGLTTALTDQEYNYKLKKEDEDASPLKIKPVVAVIKEANMTKFSPEGKLGQKKTHRRWSFLSQTPESPQKQGGRHSRHWSAHAGNGGNVQSSVRRRGSSYDYMSMSTKSSRSSSTSSGRSSWHQLENDPGFAPNQLEKPMLFLNTINDDGLQDIGEGEEEEEEEEGEEEHEDKKEEVIKKDGIKKKNTEKLIKSAHMLDNIYAVDSPVKDCGGQKEFGTRCTMNDFEEVLGLLRLLRSNNCLGNLSEQTEREVYVGSDWKNVKKKEYSPTFNEILKELDAIYLGANHDIQTALSPILTVSKLVADLRRELTETSADGVYKKVHLWSAYPRAFSTVENGRGRSRRFFSLHEVTPYGIHIFISSSHVNPVEAVLHSYAQARGFDHPECVLLELLGSKKLKKAKSPLLPDRIYNQIKNASYEELAMMVHRTSRVIHKTKKRHHNKMIERVLIELARGIRDEADHFLLDTVNSKQRAKRWGTIPFGLVIENIVTTVPSDVSRDDLNSIDKKLLDVLVHLVKRACWKEEDMRQLNRLIGEITRCTREGVPMIDDILAIQLHLLCAMRMVAISEMNISVRDMDAFPIRDADIIVVLIEMIGLDEDVINCAFDMSRRETGKLLYEYIRSQMVQEEPPSFIFKPKKKEIKDEESKYSKYASGMFFSISTLLEICLVLTTGDGLFASMAMSDDEKSIASVAMLLAFVICGAVNASIGRVGSYYMFQYSFDVAIVTVTERVMMGCIMMLLGATMCSIVCGLYMQNFIYALYFFGYSFGFGTYLLMLAALTTIRIHPVWMSSGGRVLLFASAVLAIPSLLIQGSKGDNRFGTEWIAPTYIGFIFLVDVMMIIFFRRICYARSQSFNNLSVPSQKQLDEWAATFCRERPELQPGNAATNNDAVDPSAAKKLEAKRKHDLRQYFCLQVEKAIKRRSQFVLKLPKWFPINPCVDYLDPVQSRAVAQRAKLFAKEHLLMKWYCLQSSKEANTQPFSSDWDSTLKEAIGAVTVKQMTDIGIRGGILFDFEGPEMLYGMCYFIFIFLDRFAFLFSGRGAFLFVGDPTSGYTQGMLWATVFLMLTSAYLELVVPKITSFNTTFKGRTYNKAEAASDGSIGNLIQERFEHKKKIYFSEVRNLSFLAIICYFFTLGLCIWHSQTAYKGEFGAQHPIVIFTIGCFGYVGLIFALFNKLFMSTSASNWTGARLVGLVYGIIAGLLGGIIFLRLTGASGSAVAATVIGGWTYGIYSIYSIQINHLSSIAAYGADHKLLSPTMQTSGQSWIGAKKCKLPSEQRKMSTKLAKLQKKVLITQDTNLGKYVLKVIHDSITFVEDAAEKINKNNLSIEGTLRSFINDANGENYVKKILKVAEAFLSNNEADIEKEMSSWVKMNKDSVGSSRSIVANDDIEQYIKSTSILIVPDNEMVVDRAHGEGYSAISSYTDSPENTLTDNILFIYIGVPWETYKKSANRPSSNKNNIFLAKALAESFVHEVAESIMGTSHSLACLAELAVHDSHSNPKLSPDGNENNEEMDAESLLPMRILCQLRLMPPSMLYILDEDTEFRVFKASGLGMDFDNDWQTMSHPVRHLILAIIYGIDTCYDDEGLATLF